MGPYTIQDLYWAYNLCPMTRSPELLKEEEKTPFTSSQWKIQGQEMRRQTWGILIYLENLCFWVIRINKILWHYVTVIKRWVKKYPQDEIIYHVGMELSLFARCLPNLHHHFAQVTSHRSHWRSTPCRTAQSAPRHTTQMTASPEAPRDPSNRRETLQRSHDLEKCLSKL